MQGSPSSQYWGSAQFQIQVGQSRHSIRLGGGDLRPLQPLADHRQEALDLRRLLAQSFSHGNGFAGTFPVWIDWTVPHRLPTLGGGDAVSFQKNSVSFPKTGRVLPTPLPRRDFKLGRSGLHLIVTFFYKKKTNHFRPVLANHQVGVQSQTPANHPGARCVSAPVTMSAPNPSQPSHHAADSRKASHIKLIHKLEIKFLN